MSILGSLTTCLQEWIIYLYHFFRLYIKSSHTLKLENIALRSQLAVYMQHYEKQKLPKTKTTPVFRQLWVYLSKHLEDWKSVLVLVKPETVIKWHRTAFKIHWKIKSRKTGRPKISNEYIELIRQIHQENPTLSPEKIHEKLCLLSIERPPAPNTIAKYIPTCRKPPSIKRVQSWNTFLKNHQAETWATDFFTVPSLKFVVLCGLVIIHHQSRKIIHFAVTTNPTSEWTIQQFRNATPYGKTPKYLIHDNDTIFRAKAFQRFLNTSCIISKRTTYKSPWQNAYAERVIGTIKRELLTQVIPINQLHLQKILYEYINNYYNTDRTHQGIGGNTPIPSSIYLPTSVEKTKLKATPILNGLYLSYKKVA